MENIFTLENRQAWSATAWSACLRRNQRRAEAAAVSARLGVVVGQLLNLVPASDLGVSVRSVAAAQHLAARGCPPIRETSTVSRHSINV
jgi:hypothetical protein